MANDTIRERFLFDNYGDLLTIGQTAEYLGLAVSTVRLYTTPSTRLLTPVRRKRKMMFARSELDRFKVEREKRRREPKQARKMCALTPSIKERMLSLHDAGCYSAEIARRCNVGNSIVSYVLKKYNKKPNHRPRSSHPNWKGGREITKAGYIKILVDKTDTLSVAMMDHHGRVLEHKYVMGKYLGRSLTANEIVHHKNRIRDDNRIENLELFSFRGHPSGGRVADLICHYVDELLQYAGELKFHLEGDDLASVRSKIRSISEKMKC